MNFARVGVVAVLLASCVTIAGGSTGAKPATGGAGVKNALRIGQYDTRAVAVAWAASKPHAKILAGKMDELKQAKAAGDQAKVWTALFWMPRRRANPQFRPD